PGDARFGASYEIRYQMPGYQYVYTSPAFTAYKLNVGGNPVPIGNPDLEPEKTAHFELNLTRTPFEAAVWYRDFRDLVGLRNVNSSPNSFVMYDNVDRAIAEGVDLTLRFRRSRHVDGWATYTLSEARGTGSNPDSH